MNQSYFQKGQTGQTLIETMVAAFILIMGISAALGLANYSLGATSTIKQQHIAIGLAREGIEVVKNMRDTNWLNEPISSDCYDFLSPSRTNTAYCYKDWLTEIYYINPTPTASETYTLFYNIANNDDRPWEIESIGSGGYGLDLHLDPDTYGAYYVPGAGNSGFFRKITLTRDTFEPFDHDNDLGPRLKVTSQVWWTDKRCPAYPDVVTNNRCLVTLETYLTNWRNFQ